MYKSSVYDFGWHYGWHIEQTYGDYDPYYVEIPDNFSVGETAAGEKMFFKDGCNRGYELLIGQDSPNGRPYLVGGTNPVEMIRLKVIGPVRCNE